MTALFENERTLDNKTRLIGEISDILRTAEKEKYTGCVEIKLTFNTGGVRDSRITLCHKLDMGLLQNSNGR